MLSPDVINAYTPLAKKTLPGDSRSILDKRNSTVTKPRKTTEMSKLGYVKPAPEDKLLAGN